MVISMATDQALIPFSWPAGVSPEQRPYYLAPVLYFFSGEKGRKAHGPSIDILLLPLVFPHQVLHAVALFIPLDFHL